MQGDVYLKAGIMIVFILAPVAGFLCEYLMMFVRRELFVTKGIIISLKKGHLFIGDDLKKYKQFRRRKWHQLHPDTI